MVTRSHPGVAPPWLGDEADPDLADRPIACRSNPVGDRESPRWSRGPPGPIAGAPWPIDADRQPSGYA